jgi:sRNA-binding protein
MDTTVDTQTTDPAELPRRTPAEHVLARLRVIFPAVFRDPPVPLKTGVRREIVERLAGEFTEAEIAGALRSWTRWHDYQRALIAGGPRFALDGSEAGEVSPAHQQEARDLLSGMRRKRAAAPSAPPPPVSNSVAKMDTPPAAAAPPADPPPASGKSGRPILSLKTRQTADKAPS